MKTSVSSKDAVIQVIRENGSRIRALGVRRLGLFGSFVRGEQHHESDVDLLVEFDPDQKNFDHFMGLSFLLEDLLRRRVELVTTEALSPYLGPSILQEVEYVPITS